MFAKKLLLLFIVFPWMCDGDVPKNLSRPCPTLRLQHNKFFTALDASVNQNDEKQILERLIPASSMPLTTMQLSARNAQKYPREIHSSVFANSAEFCKTMADCVDNEAINTRALESKFALSTSAKFLWLAAGIIVGCSSAFGYVRYVKY